MLLEEDDLERILRREELTLEDVKIVLRSVRYDEQDAERIAYANTLLREAGDYLPSYTLSALVRADKVHSPNVRSSRRHHLLRPYQDATSTAEALSPRGEAAHVD